MSFYFFHSFVLYYVLSLFYYNVSSSGDVTLTTQPGNAATGKPFGVQPQLQGILLSGNNLSIDVTSDCPLNGSKKFEFSNNKNIVTFIDLQVNHPGRCILTFVLTIVNISSQIQSSPFQVVSSELYFEINRISAVHNTSNYFNLHVGFTLHPQSKKFKSPWNYSISLTRPLSQENNFLTGQECNGKFYTTPLELHHCTIVNWGYKHRITINLNSQELGWYLTNTSAPFDVFSDQSPQGTPPHSVVVRVEGSMPLDYKRDNFLKIFLNKFAILYPQQRWSSEGMFAEEKGIFGMKWNVQGNVTTFKDICSQIGAEFKFETEQMTFRPPIKLDDEEVCTEEIAVAKKWWENVEWKTVVLGLVICALILPVCVLAIIWPRREREIQEKYQERLLRYAATPKHRADNTTYEPDETTPSRTNSVSNISPNRASIKKKTDFVQLTASQLQEQHYSVLPDQQSEQKHQQQNNKPVKNGPQRVHLLRSRPPSKPTVVSPATAQYASVDAPSPDNSIEMLARDILATPNTYNENQKVLTGPMVSSLVRFRPNDSATSRVIVSSLAEAVNRDLHKAGTSLPEPQ